MSDSGYAGIPREQFPRSVLVQRPRDILADTPDIPARTLDNVARVGRLPRSACYALT